MLTPEQMEALNETLRRLFVQIGRRDGTSFENDAETMETLAKTAHTLFEIKRNSEVIR